MRNVLRLAGSSPRLEGRVQLNKLHRILQVILQVVRGGARGERLPFVADEGPGRPLEVTLPCCKNARDPRVGTLVGVDVGVRRVEAAVRVGVGVGVGVV